MQRKVNKALGLVKDQTTIGLAKVGVGASSTDLEVVIVKLTRHNKTLPDEKHYRELIGLTSYSRYHVSLAVSIITRRLGKTRNWIVALKCLILTHRLLLDGDPAFEQEFSSTTRRGIRFLNLSDFRDVSHSDSWDFSAFVRTYALYLDQRLGSMTKSRDSPGPSKLFQEMGTEKVFGRIQSLQHTLERFLATRPTGFAKYNRLVVMSLFPVVQESVVVYKEITQVMNILIDRLVSLDVADRVSVYEAFVRVGKLLDELDAYYEWSKSVGIARSFEYPVIDRVTPKKLQILDDFIRRKSASFKRTRQKMGEEEQSSSAQMKALPSPLDGDHPKEKIPAPEDEGKIDEQNNHVQVNEGGKDAQESNTKEEDAPDLLDLAGDPNAEEDQLALALFSGETSGEAPVTSIDSMADWEVALVESTSGLGAKRVEMGGGFDRLTLDGLYDSHVAHSATNQAAANTGSASSMVLVPPQKILPALLPPPSTNGSGGGDSTSATSGLVVIDPFAASTVVPPPSYVQMSDMEKKQSLMVQEQKMWEQYARNGLQGQVGLATSGLNSYPGPGLMPGSCLGI